MNTFDRPLKSLLTTAKAIVSNYRPLPEENGHLQKTGHREFVGGAWDKMALLQFDFMVAQGLKPNHIFLDIACGALRGGRLFIPYLNPGNYLGIDKHGELIEAGVSREIPVEVVAAKRPELLVSESFEFGRFSKKPDFCLAQSLFSHVSPGDIKLCLTNLAADAAVGCRFFATFFETPVPIPQIARSHSNRRFSYTRGQMAGFGTHTGWRPNYIGDWGHPTQRMMEFALL